MSEITYGSDRFYKLLSLELSIPRDTNNPFPGPQPILLVIIALITYSNKMPHIGYR